MAAIREGIIFILLGAREAGKVPDSFYLLKLLSFLAALDGLPG
jgi:hypothetical protein